MRKLLFLFISASLLCSCDYTGVYLYDIQNKTTESTIEFMFQKHNDTILQSVVVYPATAKKIMNAGSGIIGMNEDPRDIFTDSIYGF